MKKFDTLFKNICRPIGVGYIYIYTDKRCVCVCVCYGYNFKALSCEAAHSSPQFPCLSIENFLLLTYRLNK